jgi:hypothetical protein
MAETSFPVVNKPLGADQWQTVALALGRGIVDRGGAPYLITNVDSVNNTITIGLDTITGKNEAVLDGFAHRMDTTKVLTIPAVTTNTVYEVGLLYDPAQAGSAAGPIVLTSWIAPGDQSNGKSRLAFHRITRSANVSLTNSPREQLRPRIAPTIAVSSFSHLPTSGLVLSDTIAMVRETGSFYRAAVSSGTVTWTELGNIQDIANATHLVVPGALVRRWSGNGTFHAPLPAAPADVANKEYVDSVRDTLSNSISNHNHSAGDITSGTLPASRIGSHNHSAGEITSGTISRARIDGSTPAWNYTISGTYSTLAVDSNGRFGKWSSTERHKTNISRWEPDPRKLLGPDAWLYDRIDQETGEVIPVREVGTIAERNEPFVPEFVQYGPDSVDEDGNPETEERVQGWDYARWTSAHQYLHKWQTRRQDATVEAVKRIAEAAGVDLSDLVADMDGEQEKEA